MLRLCRSDTAILWLLQFHALLQEGVPRCAQLIEQTTRAFNPRLVSTACSKAQKDGTWSPKHETNVN